MAKLTEWAADVALEADVARNKDEENRRKVIDGLAQMADGAAAGLTPHDLPDGKSKNPSYCHHVRDNHSWASRFYHNPSETSPGIWYGGKRSLDCGTNPGGHSLASSRKRSH